MHLNSSSESRTFFNQVASVIFIKTGSSILCRFRQYHPLCVTAALNYVYGIQSAHVRSFLNSHSLDPTLALFRQQRRLNVGFSDFLPRKKREILETSENHSPGFTL